MRERKQTTREVLKIMGAERNFPEADYRAACDIIPLWLSASVSVERDVATVGINKSPGKMQYAITVVNWTSH